MKILYVDDEAVNLMVFQVTFSKVYDVLTAPNGQKGLDLLENNRDIKFVISDMKMPGMNGLEFIKEAKKINSNLPCMLLSAYEQNDEIDTALKEELIIDYMMKPFNKEKIINSINLYAE